MKVYNVILYGNVLRTMHIHVLIYKMKKLHEYLVQYNTELLL